MIKKYKEIYNSILVFLGLRKNVEKSMKDLNKSIKKASKNWKGVNVDEFLDEVKGICKPEK